MLSSVCVTTVDNSGATVDNSGVYVVVDCAIVLLLYYFTTILATS